MTQRGSIYLVSLGLVILLTITGASLLLRATSETNVSGRARSQDGALHAAEAGLDQALKNLRTASGDDDIPTGTFASGSFSILSVTALGSDTHQVSVRGTVGNEQRTIDAITRRMPKSVFQYALFGDQAVTIGGDVITNSYDSRNGPYDPNNHGQNGDVGTNCTTSGGITVGGSIFVDGQLVVGVGTTNPQSVVTGYEPAFVTGGTTPPSDTQDVVTQSGPFPMPLVSAPGGVTCSDLKVNGGEEVVLSPTGGPLGNGTYCYEDLEVLGNGTFTATGNVKVYVTGELKLGGNSQSAAVVGASGDPTKMMLLLTSTAGATVGTITGSANFYGMLYAPGATVNLSGNAKVFGSVVGRSVNASGNAIIHYDEATTTRTDVSNLYTTSVVSWREP